MSASRVPVTFEYAEKGSRVLRQWNEERRLARALADRARRGQRDSGFAGAAINRLTMSLAQWSGAVNADLDSALAVLRARARSLCANNEWGRRFLSLVAVNMIGATGPTLQVRAKTSSGALDKAANDAIESHWTRWGRSAEITGRMSLARLLQVVAKSVARDGEALVRIVRDRRLPYGMGLQLLEADRLDETLNARLPNGNAIRMGVEVDSALRPLAYHVLTAHPGENWGSGPRQYDRIDAREIYHVYLPERAEQVRGYTWLHAVLTRAAMTGGYEEAAIIAARVGASKMGVFKRSEEASPDTLKTIADGQDATTGALQMNAEPGEFVELPVGYELQSWDPEYPHANFEAFLKQCLRGLATGVDVATHNLSGDMTGVNYSSARIAEMAEREVWTLLQQWLIDALLLPLFRDWLASALLRSEITFEATGKALPAERLDKFADAAKFQGRRWAWVDPLNEAQAAQVRLENGLDSRTAIVAASGREFDDVIDELAQEAAMLPKAQTTKKGTPAPAG